MKQILMRMFGHPHGVLGRLGGVIMAHTNQKCAAWVIELLEVLPSDKILEVGFGPGVGIELLNRSAPTGYIAGADPSKEMVEAATAWNGKAIKSGLVDPRICSVDRLPFDDNTFDKALAIKSMQAWPDAYGRQRVRPVGSECSSEIAAIPHHRSMGRDTQPG
jgi:SAM-dependent methyltransferase